MDIICGSRFLAKITIIVFIAGLSVGLYLAFRFGFTPQECVAPARLAAAVLHV